jgi:tetratricopeptide (TPR) repeat protein
MRALLLALVCAGAAARPCAAQTQHADSLWNAGRMEEARRAYEEVLVGDLENVRANYRLGILLSWDGKLDSALVMIRRARAEDPGDPDLEVAEARVLSWAGRYDEAVAHYDSVITRTPDHRDAWIGKATALSWDGRYGAADAAYVGWLERSPDDIEARVGRARIRAWQGDLAGSRALYRETLDRQPGSAAALAGLAQVDRWEGRERIALARVDSALLIAPDDRDALLLRRELRAALRPQVQFTFGWSGDSDDNDNWWENAVYTQRVGDAVTATASVGLLQASDPFTTGDRTSGELGLSWRHGRIGLSGGLGVRHLAPESGSSRSPLTARASFTWRPGPRVGIGIGVARVPFDETAGLIARELDVTSVEGNVDVKVRNDIDLTLGVGGGWLSDGNSRGSFLVAGTWSFAKYFFAGPFYRQLSYQEAGVGYFSPDPYQLAELRAGAARQWGPWGARLVGGFGSQRIDSGDRQDAWHADVRITRRMRVVDEIAIFGGVTNAAAASTTGAFKSRTAGLSLRFGL